MNEKQYSITVTTGLINALNQAELEAVLGHELTHIRNGDVRMMVIAVIIAGVISFFGEMIFRMFTNTSYSFSGGRSSSSSSSSGDRKGGGAVVAILIAVVLILVAWLLSVVVRLALSRSREFLADAGSVELTKNPDAMISALRKIEGRGELPGVDLGGDGDVHRQSARGLQQPFRHPPLGRPARGGAGEIRRRSRSGADRAPAPKDAGRKRGRNGGARFRRHKSRPVERAGAAGNEKRSVGLTEK